jgi:uncharacterized protein DUF6518
VIGLAVVAVAGGLLLGGTDFLWIKFVPFPLGELGNSSAVWAVAAFFLGYGLRAGALRSAAAGAVLLVVAVAGYYLTAAAVQGDELAVLWAPSSVLWMGFGVVAGVVFGTGGTWARGTGWRRIVGTALPAAVLLAEAALLARRVGEPRYHGAAWPALLDAALAVLIVLLLARTARHRLAALAASVPLAAIGLAGFLAAGFS